MGRVIETITIPTTIPVGARDASTMVGSGTGTLYLDGHAYDVRWSRPSASAGTTWTYAKSGDPVVLPPGIVWWEVIPTYATAAED